MDTHGFQDNGDITSLAESFMTDDRFTTKDMEWMFGEDQFAVRGSIQTLLAGGAIEKIKGHSSFKRTRPFTSMLKAILEEKT